MKYMGSKRRIAKHILPIILKGRIKDQWFVEPFCGGCNITMLVEGNRLASDSNYYLIEMWKSLVNDNWDPPKTLSEETYKHIKSNMGSIHRVKWGMLDLIPLELSGLEATVGIIPVKEIIGWNTIIMS